MQEHSDTADGKQGDDCCVAKHSLESLRMMQQGPKHPRDLSHHEAAVTMPHLCHHADGFLLGREGVLGQGICGVQHEGVDARVAQAAAAVQPVVPPAHV
jgi:hypothetical protein